MGTKYSTQTAAGYNAGPPSDDGTVSEANKGKWATIKQKLSDPIKALSDAINAALLTALDVSVTTQTSAYSTQPSDHLRPILVTGDTTISLGDAATMEEGYQVTVVNIGAGTVTVALVTNTDTLEGTTNGTFDLSPGMSATYVTNATGYRSLSKKPGSIVRASVKWQSDGTILVSDNVSSVTDSGTGDFIVNFITIFPSAHYITNAVAIDTNPPVIPGYNQTASACEVVFRNAAGTPADSTNDYSAAFIL